MRFTKTFRSDYWWRPSRRVHLNSMITCVFLWYRSTGCIVAPEYEHELIPTIEANVVHIKIVENRQTQIECQIKVEHKDSERKVQDWREEVRIDLKPQWACPKVAAPIEHGQFNFWAIIVSCTNSLYVIPTAFQECIRYLNHWATNKYSPHPTRKSAILRSRSTTQTAPEALYLRPMLCSDFHKCPLEFTMYLAQLDEHWM